MAYQQVLAPVVRKEFPAKDTVLLEIQSVELADQANPGQFVHVLPQKESFLRRPISICKIDRTKHTLTLVFALKGDGTHILAEAVPGTVLDILGPLGKGFTLSEKAEHVITIGGGIGNPPMVALAEYYGEKATSICGFRSANAVILQDDFAASGVNTVLCTDDGTAGIHGFVTTALEQECEKQTPDMIYACGPKPMLKAIATYAMEHNIPCEVSLEERMGCGIGACLVCACGLKDKDGEEYMGHVCKNGPVFRAEEVVW